MVPRFITPYINDLSGKFPVITVTGPRQGGKTTLLKSLFPEMPYLSMETPDIRAQVLANPRGVFAQYGHRMILDEVQRTPDILSYIQTIVDDDPGALFILSGSQNLLMLEQVTQSLAGRAAIFYLLPFSLAELEYSDIGTGSFESHIFNGFYPRLYDRDLQPHQFYPNYIETYVQRDVRAIKNIGNLNLFMRFLAICAGHIGQVVNFSSLANDAGVSVNTARSWLSLLEASFIIYQVNPYFRNFNKRLIKSPKLYFYDTGLACSLLRINNVQALQNYYQKGSLFENFIITEVCKEYYNQGLRPPIYYWRDNHKNEIDLILDMGGQLIPIEIKSSRTYHSSFFKTLAWWRDIVDLPILQSYVIYGGDQDWELEHGKLLSWKRMAEIYEGGMRLLSEEE